VVGNPEAVGIGFNRYRTSNPPALRSCFGVAYMNSRYHLV
jgi:hypothetical protein